MTGRVDPAEQECVVDETKPRIVNLHELELQHSRSHGTKYESKHAIVGGALGSRKLGYNLTELPPGKTAFPYHFHHVNEEMFLVLEGEGTLRWPGGKSPLKAGDLICCPPGPDGAHQIVNSSEERLVYLALSTLQDPEVAEYPDSGKYAVFAGRPPHARPQDAAFYLWAYKKDAVDYWEGED
jgi:uncharacterized cupin superfamily protein